MRIFVLFVYVCFGERVGVLQKNGNTIQANPKAQMSNPHSGPVLGCSWNSGGNKIYTVSADKTGASILYTYQMDGMYKYVRTAEGGNIRLHIATPRLHICILRTFVLVCCVLKENLGTLCLKRKGKSARNDLLVHIYRMKNQLERIYL